MRLYFECVHVLFWIESHFFLHLESKRIQLNLCSIRSILLDEYTEQGLRLFILQEFV